MTVYVANIGSGLLLVDAADEDHARKALGIRLHYEHKPWITARIEVREPTDDDRALLMAHNAKIWKAPAVKDPTKGKQR